MIPKNILIVDSNYICYRSMYKLMGLSHDQHPVGVIYGFLRQIQTLANKFNYPSFIFVWDSRKSFRREAFPGYKMRDEITNTEMLDIISVGKPQFSIVRTKILPRLGFRNNFIQTGIEADDLTAQIVNKYQSWLGEGQRFVIVTGDDDLLQLLHDVRVVIYDPLDQETTSEEDFIKEKGISPSQWPWVKAVAGCKSDTVPGIDGIGEGFAIQYLKGTLPEGKRKEKIRAFDPTFNLSLVSLPHKLTKPVELVENEFDIRQFEPICLDYGFHSLLKKENYLKWKKILGG